MVATIGLFIVVGESVGAAVDRSRTLPVGGALCHTTTAAVIRASIAANTTQLGDYRAPLTWSDCPAPRIVAGVTHGGGVYKVHLRRHRE